jgi:5-formyltetrahydrofolate cyclo-ligase
VQAADTKAAARAEALRRRDAIPSPVRKIKDSLIRERLVGLPEFERAKSVLLYASFRSEVATAGIAEDALRAGKRVAMPRCEPETETLVFHAAQSLEELSPGYMGIPEPAEAAPTVGGGEVDMVIIPGAAFDPGGWRLGYGKGYYDKFLGELKGRVPLVALAYEEQIAEGLPHEGHDVPVDMIVTDKRIIRCGGQRED